MTNSFDVIPGDCVEVLSLIDDESVDAVVTSPPYANQRKSTYGGISEAEYPDWTVEWMAQIKRVLKPSGSVLIVISPHVKNGQLSDYVLRTRLALREDGWNEAREMIWHKPNGIPSGPPDRPRRSWESILWFSKTNRPFSDAKANGGAPSGNSGLQRGPAERNKWDHSYYGSNTTPERTRCADVVSVAVGARTPATVIDHPAPYPVTLAEWLVRLITPAGGLVLDPFSGISTTGIAAYRNGRDYIGIERDPRYIDGAMKWHEAEILGDLA